MQVIDGIVLFHSAEQSLLDYTGTLAFSGMTLETALAEIKSRIDISPTDAIDYVNQRILERLARRIIQQAC